MKSNKSQQHKNIQFDAVPHVREICMPLKALNIHSFVYMKRFPNGEFIDLFTDPYWADFSLYKLFDAQYSMEILTQHNQCMSKAVSFWNIENNQDVWLEAKQHFNYSNGISLNFPNKDYQETFCYYTNMRHTSIEELDMQFIEFLRYFSVYFSSRAEKLIARANRNRLKTPEIYLPQPIAIAREQNFNFHNIIELLKPEKLKVNNVVLSAREIECIRWLAHGKSAEEIGIILSLSRRTIEKHLLSVKQKLGCHKITQIIQICNNSPLKIFLKDWCD